MNAHRMVSERSRSTASTASPARQASLREHNLSLVLRHICSAGSGVSRAHLARHTGLTRATVSELVDLLLQAGMVRELTPQALAGAGRPATPVIPAEQGLRGIGIDIAVDHIAVCTVTLTGTMATQRVIEGEFALSHPERLLARVSRMVEATIADTVAAGAQVAGVCVALPGLVDPEHSRLRHAPNLNWSDLPIGELLRTALGRPELAVLVGNDASLAATAEVLIRARREDVRATADFLYITGEVGIGGAIVRRGELSGGTRGWAGEIGHTNIDANGELCTCGARGCLERYAGKAAFIARAGLPPGSSWEQLHRSIAGGDPAALAAVAEVGAALGVAAASALNVLDIDTILLGGAYASLADQLAPGILAELRNRVIAVRFAGAEVYVEGALGGEHAALHGAGLTVVNAVLANPSAWLDTAP